MFAPEKFLFIIFYLMEKFLNYLKRLPIWLRFVVAILAAVLVAISTMSCGTPKTTATVHNINPNSSVTVTMTVSNTNTTTPSVDTDNTLSHGTGTH